jgi:hypothetical protein
MANLQSTTDYAHEFVCAEGDAHGVDYSTLGISGHSTLTPGQLMAAKARRWREANPGRDSFEFGDTIVIQGRVEACMAWLDALPDV